jgi:hypothetical protein
VNKGHYNLTISQHMVPNIAVPPVPPLKFARVEIHLSRPIEAA